MEERDFKELLKYKIFKFRGRDKDGIDCFGFFLDCFKRMNMEVPDYVYTKKNAYRLLLKEYHKHFVRVDHPKRGDAILFKGDRIHIGVYMGNGQFVHFREDIGAKLDYIHQKPWIDMVYGYFRRIRENG